MSLNHAFKLNFYNNLCEGYQYELSEDKVAIFLFFAKA